MRDFIFKVRVLWMFVREAYECWLIEVWRTCLDDYDCCNGGTSYHNICGCNGATKRQVYQPVRRP